MLKHQHAKQFEAFSDRSIVEAGLWPELLRYYNELIGFLRVTPGIKTEALENIPEDVKTLMMYIIYYHKYVYNISYKDIIYTTQSTYSADGRAHRVNECHQLKSLQNHNVDPGYVFIANNSNHRLSTIYKRMVQLLVDPEYMEYNPVSKKAKQPDASEILDQAFKKLFLRGES